VDRSRLSREIFGTLSDGSVVDAVTLVNANGMSVCIIGYGASIQSVYVPDRHGALVDVTTGYATLDDYVNQPQFFGSTVGRVANRVANARFSLNGVEYNVPANDGSSSLHGGTCGFDKVNWTITACEEDTLSVSLQYISPDGDQGYPGRLTTVATYSLDNDNMLTVHYRATTDAPTVVNLSNHAYWNLGGEGSPHSAMDHRLVIYAEEFLPVDARLIPTGERRSVAGGAFDFRQLKTINHDLREANDTQIAFGCGYDHNWIIRERPIENPQPVAYLEDPRSGRTMTLSSNQPGLQFYSGNFFDGSTLGKAGKFYRMGDAIALEPQCFPDTPNQSSFGTIELAPGDVYSNIICWRFGIADEK
jgi:aldose 1-epimerase